MWFKKKSVLQADHHYDTEKSADGLTDLRTTYKFYVNTNSSIATSGRPSAADAGKYFFLPALGIYDSGRLNGVGSRANYWSSNAQPRIRNFAYNMYFESDLVNVGSTFREYGFRVGGLE